MNETKCELCGSPVRVVGRTTMSYEPIANELQKKLEMAHHNYAGSEIDRKHFEELSGKQADRISHLERILIERTELHNKEIATRSTLEADLKAAREALGNLASGILPNGDHVDGVAFEYAREALGKLRGKDQK